MSLRTNVLDAVIDGHLAKVTNEDCVFIDDLMTRYSVFQHAQSDEKPSSTLKLDVFEADVTALQRWITEFGARAA